MGIQFSETMAGTLTPIAGGGAALPAAFHIRAESPELAGFLRHGTARVAGVLEAAPWCDDGLVEGTIAIDPWITRTIRYDLRVEPGQGPPLRLVGQKRLRLLRPWHGATHLPVELRDAASAAPLARGSLDFPAAQLPTFLASWFPAASLQMRAAANAVQATQARSQELSALDPEEQALWLAFAQALIPSGQRVPEVDRVTVAGALALLHSLAPHMGAGLGGALLPGLRRTLSALDRLARLTTGRSLAALPVARRRAWLNARFSGPRAPLLQLLSLPFRHAHFERRDYLDAIGHPRARALVQAEPRPRWWAQVHTPESTGPAEEVECDVVVVGTGAGGGAMAAALAERGHAVCMIEEGRLHRREEFGGSPTQRVQALWRSAGTTVGLGAPVSLPMGRAVGGTTLINSGTCFATPDEVLIDWVRHKGLPADLAPSQFHGYTERVAAALQVEPASPGAVGAIGRVIARGAEAMGLDHGPLPRNAPGCPGAGECIFGCPEGAKRSADIAWVPRALACGAELYTGLAVTQLLRRGGRIIAVEARGVDHCGAPRRLRVRARRVVLACGTLLTPQVLWDSGISLPRIGRNLSIHPSVGVLARLDPAHWPEPIAPWAAIPQGYAVHALHAAGVRFEGYYLPPSFAAMALPFVGDELTAWMDEFDRVAQFGFMVRDRGVGRVWRSSGARPLVTYVPEAATRATIARASALLAELLLRAGAREVTPGLASAPRVRTRDEARALAELPLQPRDLRLLGPHPLGTCAMGRTPADGVVDGDHRVFDTDNLHVVDGSAVPTSLGVNPQMTIMALALRAGDRIAAALESSAG
jgi:choline dehydrogenase-like flavoprotein